LKYFIIKKREEFTKYHPDFDFSQENVSDDAASELYSKAMFEVMKKLKLPYEFIYIAAQESGFVNRVGDTNHYFRGMYNPSESYLQIGRLTQVDAWNEAKKRGLTPDEPFVTREIKKDWPDIFTYFESWNKNESSILAKKRQNKERYDPDWMIIQSDIPDITGNDYNSIYAATFLGGVQYLACLERANGDSIKAAGIWNDGLDSEGDKEYMLAVKNQSNDELNACVKRASNL
jgi:hypothetical protein